MQTRADAARRGKSQEHCLNRSAQKRHIKPLFTIRAQIERLLHKGRYIMGQENDRLMMVRAELSDQLDALRLTSFQATPVQFLMRLDAIRKTAQSHRFEAVAEIASAFEAAMQSVIHGKGASGVIDSFTQILEDAIGAKQLEASVARALLANVALRLHG